MLSSIDNSGAHRTAQLMVHDGSNWVPAGANPHPEIVWPSAFTEGHYLGEGTVWQRDVSKMPLAENSEVMAAWMWDNLVDPWGNKGYLGDFSQSPRLKAAIPGTGLNISNHPGSTSPIAMYLVDSSVPSCPMVDMKCVSGFPAMPAWELRAIEKNVPFPSFAHPGVKGDQGMAIYDVATGVLREFFMVSKQPDGTWTGTIGYSTATPGLRSLADDNYGTQLRSGSSAVARMHNNLGFIGISEVRGGAINHALAFTFGAVAHGNPPSWPASGSDGKSPESEKSKSPTHGQWGRVKASVDPMHNPRTGRPYNPLTRMLIVAAQKYGLVGTDTNSWVHAFNVEDGSMEQAFFGQDPWVDPNGLRLHIAQEYKVPPELSLDVSDFPWDQTEWAPVDWGRPDVDFVSGVADANNWRRDRASEGKISQ